MIEYKLVIKCQLCGKEETVISIVQDRVVDINLNKICPNCYQGWMVKKELTLNKH